jgi:AcrR family transcriptional regulator
MVQDTTSRLIATARQVFAEQGFSAVSLDVIAAKAGVTRGALHHHFKNKAGLFKAVFHLVDAEIEAALDIAWENEPDKWVAFRLCFLRFLDETLEPGRSRILFQDGPAVLGSLAFDILLEGGFNTLVSDLRGFIETGRIIAVDPEAMAHVLNGAALNLAFWVSEGTGNDDRLTRARATLANLLDALVAAGPYAESRTGSCLPAQAATADPNAENSGRDTGSDAAFHSGCHWTDNVNPGASFT